MSAPRRSGLLHYWSVRYFVILIGSAAVLVPLMAYFIQLDVRQEQHRAMKGMASELAAAVNQDGGLLRPEIPLGRWLDELTWRHGLRARMVMFVMDGDGRIVQQFPPDLPDEASQLADLREQILSGEPQILKLDRYRDNPVFLVAVHPMDQHGGYVLLMKPEEKLAQWIAYFNRRLAIAAAIMLMGWGVIYMLMRRLVKPIKEARAAAKQIVAGDYNIQLNREYREQEVHELMHAFKEMADRLSWLESMRTQLLAGVTHELKTPVASISSLVQAVRDGVAEGEEADEFLDMSLKECLRLQRMVEDLLDFNSFAGQAVDVSREECDLEAVLREIVGGWQYTEARSAAKVEVVTEQNGMRHEAATDPHRLQQIMVNLLNNARDASEAGGAIQVRLTREADQYRIEVKDRGYGIPEEEQEDIFEPFYRGKRKKLRVRGLGIGLPYSRLIARSLGGELQLTSSGPAGTTFALTLPRK